MQPGSHYEGSISSKFADMFVIITQCVQRYFSSGGKCSANQWLNINDKIQVLMEKLDLHSLAVRWKHKDSLAKVSELGTVKISERIRAWTEDERPNIVSAFYYDLSVLHLLCGRVDGLYTKMQLEGVTKLEQMIFESLPLASQHAEDDNDDDGFMLPP